MFLKKLTKAAAVKRGKGKSKRKEQKARKINQQKGQNDRRDAAARNEIREPEAPSGKSAVTGAFRQQP